MLIFVQQKLLHNYKYCRVLHNYKKSMNRCATIYKTNRNGPEYGLGIFDDFVKKVSRQKKVISPRGCFCKKRHQKVGVGDFPTTKCKFNDEQKSVGGVVQGQMTGS